MCAVCGCSGAGEAAIGGAPVARDHAHPHRHDHAHAHPHGHEHAPGPGAIVTLEERLLAKNDRLAERNRGWFLGRGILALNLMSAPGAGKTSLIERTIGDLGGELAISVVEGDQAGERDAARIRAAGAAAVQVNTGAGCHLDAAMLAQALTVLQPPPASTVIVENVGNLVCPALFDLGERARVVLVSVAEGDDKPFKYPHMFRAADLVVVTKSDLLPHVDFDVERCLAAARALNRTVQTLVLSARTGEGTDAWYDWLRTQRAAAKP